MSLPMWYVDHSIITLALSLNQIWYKTEFSVCN